MIEVTLTLIFIFWVGHFLADHPLQGPFLSSAKNPTAPIPGVPWIHAMTAHCTIHAGAVYFISGSMAMAGFEFFSHFAIDYAKCKKLISYEIDQLLHLSIKVGYAIILVQTQT